jgi:hypothetical protein
VKHLASWRSLVEREDYTCPLANFAWDALRVADLPQIAASLAPRPVIVDEAKWDFASLAQL